MRVMIHSNPPWVGSGYGSQTALLAKHLPDLGHEVAVAAMSGLNGRPLDWDGTLVLPSGMRQYSNDVLAAHARRVFGADPGLILTLYDVWAIDPEPLQKFATAAWVPIQSHPVPPADLNFFQVSGAQAIAMSRYGERELTAAGLQPVYVPHAVDTSVFKPLSAAERALAREMLQVPQDAFVVAIVAANKDKTPPRKGWGEQMWAFAEFRKRHKDAVLLVHSLLETSGVNLVKLVYDLGIQDAVQFTDQYAQVTGLYGPEDVAAVMGCADVLSNCSWGEGFGLPVLEAQACGTPVVVTDGSAGTELCGSGWLVETQPYWHPFAESWWHTPIIKSIGKAWEKAYQHVREPKMREKAREFALGYDVDTVMTQYWKPAMEMLEQYAGAELVRTPGNHGSVPLPTREADGLRWIVRGPHTDDWITFNHEDSLEPVLSGLLPDGGVFVDVGAHVGRWSLRLAGKASQVYAVEPNPATVAVLRAHIAMNEVRNVHVLEMAAWDSEAQMSLSDPGQKVTGGSTRVIEGGGTVTARLLDDVLADIARLDLVKLDVEGADLHALRGMRATLARLKPTLFIEDHSMYGYYELTDLEALLTAMGYRWRTVRGYQSADGRTIEAPYLICVPIDEEESDGNRT